MIPQEKDKQLDNNYSMALSRLANTEKRLLKGIELGKRYNEIIARYFEKGFLETVDKKDKKWLVSTTFFSTTT